MYQKDHPTMGAPYGPLIRIVFLRIWQLAIRHLRFRLAGPGSHALPWWHFQDWAIVWPAMASNASDMCLLLLAQGEGGMLGEWLGKEWVWEKGRLEDLEVWEIEMLWNADILKRMISCGFLWSSESVLLLKMNLRHIFQQDGSRTKHR